MSYIVLARRFRPTNFDQIIGQEHVSRTLKNAIAENRVAHAYLFSGPRGVGKTTIARIMAKSLNCKEGPTSDPCGKCSNCEEIASGSSVDVQEIDGASNRGIDEIRSLRENVKFAPASSKYKIYIIDEAHQITDAAFNALLKTVEEPPEHVVFILATTEAHKIPVTILSRCQRYRFRMISLNEIMSALEKIVHSEGFEIEPEALKAIALSAGGSMRDALSLLDQAVSFVSGKITFSDIQNLLGFLPHEIVYSTTEAIAKQNGEKILEIIRNVNDQGYSMLQFARDLREHLRHLMLFSLNPSVLEITEDEKKGLENQKSLYNTAWLIRSGHLLSKALDEMRWSDQPRLLLELYLLKLAQPYAAINELIQRLESIESLEKDSASTDFLSSPGPRLGHSRAGLTGGSSVVDKKPPDTPLKHALECPNRGPEYDAKNSMPQPDKVVDADIKSLWKEVVREFCQQRPRLGSILAEAQFKSSTATNIFLALPNKFAQEGIKRDQQLIEDIMEKKFGRRFMLSLSVEELTAKAQEPVKEDIVVAEEEANASAPGDTFKVETDLSQSNNELPHGMDKILNKFPGKITKKK